MIVVTLLLILYLIFVSIAQDEMLIGDISQIKDNITTTEMIENCPLYMRTISNNREHKCKCYSGELYYPPSNTCFLAHTRGPCNSGEFFILTSKIMVATCAKNPCGDGFVMYEQACYKFPASGAPCKDSQILGSHAGNYKVSCINGIIQKSVIIVPRGSDCPPGTQMNDRGECRTPA